GPLRGGVGGVSRRRRLARRRRLRAARAGAVPRRLDARERPRLRARAGGAPRDGAAVRRQRVRSPRGGRGAAARGRRSRAGDRVPAAARRRLGRALPGHGPRPAEGTRAARPGLIRAAELLAGVLRDFPEQSRARDVADALGDADMPLGRYAQANGDYERAMELARPDAADADLQLASLREKVAEANRALR